MADKLKLKSFPRNFTVLRLVQETDLPRKLILVLDLPSFEKNFNFQKTEKLRFEIESLNGSKKDPLFLIFSQHDHQRRTHSNPTQ